MQRITNDLIRGTLSLTSLLLYLAISTHLLSCEVRQVEEKVDENFPKLSYGVGFIPYDPNVDDPTFKVCDSTKIYSGRNALQYAGGNTILKAEILDGFRYDNSFKSFNGFIVVHFLRNCKSEMGRFRYQVLHPDFSPAVAPDSLLAHVKSVVAKLKKWSDVQEEHRDKDFSKFINLKITNGQVQHVLL